MNTEETPTTDLITLTRYVLRSTPRLILIWSQRHVLSEQMRLGASVTGDLTLLLTAIQVTSKFIATNVRKARLINL
jgi:fructose-1,6-bisphosphatase I